LASWRAPSVDARIPYRRGLPFLGDLLALRRDRIAAFEQVRREKGNLAAFNWGPLPVVMLSDPALVQTVLVDKVYDFRKGDNYRLLAAIMGDGLIIVEEDEHIRQRKLLQPGFSRGQLPGYVATMADVVDAQCADWSDGASIDLVDQMARGTLDVVARTLLRISLHAEIDILMRASEAANVWASDELSRLIHLPLSIPVARHRRLRAALAAFDAFIYRTISERRASSLQHDDLISAMFRARDESGRGMTDKQIRDQIITVLIAGHETTALALSWTLYLLSQHPEARAHLEQEVHEVLGERAPTFEDVGRLRYAQQVVKEAMRLYPPIPYFSRRAIRDVELGGCRIAAGQAVLCWIYGIHHRGDLYPSPERFDPDRFAPEAEKRLPKAAFLPFGLGPRVCIGNHFALTEAVVFLARLTQRFRLELAPGQVIEAEPLISLRPKGGIRMIVRRRENQDRRMDPTAHGTALQA
jgi:cytochrome P450